MSILSIFGFGKKKYSNVTVKHDGKNYNLAFSDVGRTFMFDHHSDFTYTYSDDNFTAIFSFYEDEEKRGGFDIYYKNRLVFRCSAFYGQNPSKMKQLLQQMVELFVQYTTLYKDKLNIIADAIEYAVTDVTKQEDLYKDIYYVHADGKDIITTINMSNNDVKTEFLIIDNQGFYEQRNDKTVLGSLSINTALSLKEFLVTVVDKNLLNVNFTGNIAFKKISNGHGTNLTELTVKNDFNTLYFYIVSITHENKDFFIYTKDQRLNKYKVDLDAVETSDVPHVVEVRYVRESAKSIFELYNGRPKVGKAISEVIFKTFIEPSYYRSVQSTFTNDVGEDGITPIRIPD